jgi:hypothetical protein
MKLSRSSSERASGWGDPPAGGPPSSANIESPFFKFSSSSRLRCSSCLGTASVTEGRSTDGENAYSDQSMTCLIEGYSTMQGGRAVDD